MVRSVVMRLPNSTKVGVIAFCVIALGAGLAAAGVRLSSGDSATNTRVTVPHDPMYPEFLWERAEKLVNSQFDEDPIPARESDDGPLRLTAKADMMIRGIVANNAKALGLPYRAEDLLTPVTDERGKLVGYAAPNAGRLISVEEARSPDFDLCAVQNAALAEARSRSTGPPPLPEGMRLNGEPAVPGSPVGC
jgi:hypothetical protein